MNMNRNTYAMRCGEEGDCACGVKCDEEHYGEAE